MPKTGSRQRELEAAGWVRQFTAEEPRLSEAVELYRALGFEVHLEPVRPEELAEGCRECFKIEPGKCKTIYTRRKDRAL